MAKASVRFLKRDKVIAELNRLSPRAGKALAEAQLKVAQDLAKLIRSYAPVRTGTYRDSIIGDYLRNQKDTGLFGARTSTDPNATGVFASKMLWRWIEFGTVKMPRRPHIFPVYRGRKRYIMRTLRRAVNDVVAGRK